MLLTLPVRPIRRSSVCLFEFKEWRSRRTEAGPSVPGREVGAAVESQCNEPYEPLHAA